MAKKKTTLKSKSNYSAPSYKFLQCRNPSCTFEERVDVNAISVLCSRCVQIAVGAPSVKQEKPKSGRPAGWHFMAEFVDKDGNVFHKGVEQTELKGTLKPTPAKEKAPPKKRISKEEKLVAIHKKKMAIKKKDAAKKLKELAKLDGIEPPSKKKAFRPKKVTPKKPKAKKVTPKKAKVKKAAPKKTKVKKATPKKVTRKKVKK